MCIRDRRNPLGEEYSTLRTQLVTSMLTVLATNASRKIPAVRFFEVSKRFVAKSLPLTEQPDEIPVLCLGLYGLSLIHIFFPNIIRK